MPPNVRKAWDDNSEELKAYLLAYESVREHEELEDQKLMLKAAGASIL